MPLFGKLSAITVSDLVGHTQSGDNSTIFNQIHIINLYIIIVSMHRLTIHSDKITDEIKPQIADTIPLHVSYWISISFVIKSKVRKCFDIIFFVFFPTFILGKYENFEIIASLF